MVTDFFTGILLGALLGLAAGVGLARGAQQNPCDGCDWCDRARKAGL